MPRTPLGVLYDLEHNPHYRPRLVINSDETWQREGRDALDQQGRRYLPKTRPFPQNGSVFELIALAASFRDPYPAFSAAIRVLFTAAGAGRDGAR